MALYLLDTDTLSLFQRGHPTVRAAVARRTADTIGFAGITLEEQVSGWLTMLRQAKSPAADAAAYRFGARLAAGWKGFPVYPASEPALARADQLLRRRLNVKRNDLRIAAVALDLGATVVTRNRRDFGRVPGLAVEDWSV